VNVAAIFSIGMHTLPEYVKKFMVSHADVNVHVEYLSFRKIYELVLSGEVDVGLVAVPRRDRRLEVYDFAEEPLALACSPKHAFAHETEIDIHRLQFERFVGFDSTVPTRGWIDSILERYSVVVRTVMEFDNIETIKRAIEINAGISILPETVIQQEVSSGTICAIPFSNEHFTRPTGIILRKDKMLSPSCRYFVEMLKKAGR
jgi:DNA-binding transcriptional LysR family regulator